MTQQVRQLTTIGGPGSPAEAAVPQRPPQPVFFFDGDFRSLEQMNQRTQLNNALMSYVAARRYRYTPASLQLSL